MAYENIDFENDKEIVIILDSALQAEGLYEETANIAERITDKMIGESKQGIYNALKAIRWVAKLTRKAVHNLDAEQAEAEFMISIVGESGIPVFKAKGEGHLKIKLIWKDINNEQSSTNTD